MKTTRLSAERLWGTDAPLPAGMKIAVNVNIQGFGRRGPGLASGKFIVAASYTPPVAQISVGGEVVVEGSEEEVDRLVDQAPSGAPPTPVVQAVLSSGMADAVLLSRSIGIPPPIPTVVPQSPSGGDKGGPRMEYTL